VLLELGDPAAEAAVEAVLWQDPANANERHNLGVLRARCEHHSDQLLISGGPPA